MKTGDFPMISPPESSKVAGRGEVVGPWGTGSLRAALDWWKAYVEDATTNENSSRKQPKDTRPGELTFCNGKWP